MLSINNAGRCSMDIEPILFGRPYSVYVRAARLTLEEKGVTYRLVPVVAFAEEGVPVDHLNRHPFGRIPAFAYRGFHLYEAGPSPAMLTKSSPELHCSPDRLYKCDLSNGPSKSPFGSKALPITNQNMAVQNN
jgi:Glutathione S-transferase, N-terminal domain